MLQQTTVTTVIPYFLKFIEKWPSFEALAQADDDQVMQAWAGLGYYARARNLLACARHINAEHGAQLPQSLDELLKLPGIGPYTAAAIRAIAFDRPAQPVDGNIERVIARHQTIATPLPALKKQIAEELTDLITPHRPSDMVQALMDLGALICTPKSPKCDLCPWHQSCRARQLDCIQTLPVKAKKPTKPQRHGSVFWVIDSRHRVLVEPRPARGLLGGMMAFPSQNWDPATSWTPPSDLIATPLDQPVHHVFTHFSLRLDIYWAQISGRQKREINASLVAPQWVSQAAIAELALPKLMQKVHMIATAHKVLPPIRGR